MTKEAIRNDPKVQQFVRLMAAYMAPHLAAGLSPEQAMEKAIADYYALINKLCRTSPTFAGTREPSRYWDAMSEYITDGVLRRVGKRCDGFAAAVRLAMTPERAAEVRRLRLDDGAGWREVALQCFRRWGESGIDGWARLPDNQAIGMALCAVAAEMLGETWT